MFANTTDLVDFAEKFLGERTASLKKDVLTCTSNTCPFPALLYCFSSVDLLGALYEGDATGDVRRYGQSVGTTAKAREYMKRMLVYPDYEVRLIQSIFRHKTVHLAQPKAVVFDRPNNRHIAWALINTTSNKHMTIERLPATEPVAILNPNGMTCDHVFYVSIPKFMEDIVNSVHRKPDGLLELIRTNPSAQRKFDKAIEHIYDPTI